MSPSFSTATAPVRTAATPIPAPGALLVFACGQPLCLPLPLRYGELTLGRATISQLTHDTRLSRRHTTIARGADGRWTVEDLGSHNGTFVDGRPLSGKEQLPAGTVVRAGSSVFVLYDDVVPFVTRPVAWRSGVVLGPEMQDRWDMIAAAALVRDCLHLTGEPGSGRELAARHYHERSGRKGPFIAVNCAAVPPTLAEELLFAQDGYLNQVGTGTLFLDEVTELDAAMQARLAVELVARDLPVCSASSASLAARLKSGAFRQDLAERLCARVVALPSLRERRADLPWIIAGVTKARGNVTPHVTLIETALLRRWPGNVRELRVHLAAATNAALDAGAIAVRASDLGTEARPLRAARR